MPKKPYIIYNVPNILLMFNKGISYEKISKMVPLCVSKECSKMQISRIIDFVTDGTIDSSKTGTLPEIKIIDPDHAYWKNRPPEDDFSQSNKVNHTIDYTVVCFELMRNYMLLKKKNFNEPSDFSLDDLKQAYLHFSKEVHPDMNKSDLDSNKKFIALKNAFEEAKKRFFPFVT